MKSDVIFCKPIPTLTLVTRTGVCVCGGGSKHTFKGDFNKKYKCLFTLKINIRMGKNQH